MSKNSSSDQRMIIVHENPKSPISEAYRTLRTNIQFSSIDETIKSMAVTSTGPGEGKSTVSANIAVTMAQAGKKVLLVDCDLRKPKVQTFFRISNRRGLTNILVENVDYQDVIYSPSDIEGLDVITSGPIPPNPSELLGSKKMKNFIKKLEEEYDTVVLDTPPIALVTDGVVLSTITDGTIIVCAVGQADIEAAKAAKGLLEKVDANILGVVMNKVPIKSGGYYRYHYYQQYSYSYYEEHD